MPRPITTLFMLMSLDGKISLGNSDSLDFDKDFPQISGLKEGLHQYYEIEQTTDLWSMNSGRVQAKMGVNEAEFMEKGPVSFVILDNSHLTAHGLEYFARKSKNFVLVTSNPEHPAFGMNIENLNIIFQEKFNPRKMLEKLYSDYGCERVTIQTGGTLNEIFLREQLFDYIDIVVAPVLIGGKDTSSLIDGSSLNSVDELKKLGILQLQSCEQLENSYLRLKYKLIKNLTIRPVEPKDDAAVKNLVQQSLKEFGLDTPGTAYFDPELGKMAEHYQAAEKAQYWVLTDDTHILGGVGIFPINATTCEVQKLYLNTELRGRGWGGKLMNHALDFAKQHYQYAYLDTRSELSNAIGMYKSFGFKELEAAPEHAIHNYMDHWFIKEL
ncbi:MAG: GNAT family N-acetyltransferase [Streptococcaceae bacterium]|jgi:2,5-diamino-6-(ribosylamino)-4(3H)-pyrimidinone 5'-phosphate reductase|nr:GNAT family N-acetyltransferase [Streptococcaceae bacterium]